MKNQSTVNNKAAFFFDGQNFFNAAKEAFYYDKVNFDPIEIAKKLCGQENWALGPVRFYTGIPKEGDWRRDFWLAKLNKFQRQGGIPIKRDLRYIRDDEIGREKGIDVRIALDIVRMTHYRNFDICVILSQDNDLAEAVMEAKEIAGSQQRKIDFVSAYPNAAHSRNQSGMQRTRWVPIDKGFYDSCLDTNEYVSDETRRMKRIHENDNSN